MSKSTRAPLIAAGGIVIRNGPKPAIAIVQRRSDGSWVLPKGKAKPNETPIATAKREAIEETGTGVRVHEFLGVISYLTAGRPKIAHFWRMEATGDTGDKTDDINAVEWLPLSAAIIRLSLPHEQLFLRHVGHHALRDGQRARIGTRPLPGRQSKIHKRPPVNVPNTTLTPNARMQAFRGVTAGFNKHSEPARIEWRG